jgi:lipoprotein-anchoring transpeptidase ErfK/SrfK
MVRESEWGARGKAPIAFILSGFLLGACVQTPRDPLANANLPPRDRALLANAPYARVTLPVAYQRTVIQFHRKEAPGSIVIGTDARYLYYVLADNKAVRYGVAVGEEALSW